MRGNCEKKRAGKRIRALAPKPETRFRGGFSGSDRDWRNYAPRAAGHVFTVVPLGNWKEWVALNSGLWRESASRFFPPAGRNMQIPVGRAMILTYRGTYARISLVH